MARSPLVTNVLENHTTINIGDDKDIRRSFYKTLGRLLFGGAQMSNFHSFVMPWQKQLEGIKVTRAPLLLLTSQTAIMTGNNREKGRKALAQILNDMRGFVTAIYSMERGYSAFFDWFYDETLLHEWLGQLMSQAANVGLTPEVCFLAILANLVRNAGLSYTSFSNFLRTIITVSLSLSRRLMVSAFSVPQHKS